MFAKFERSWPLLFLLIAIGVVIIIFLRPELSRPLGIGVLALGALATVILVSRKHALRRQAGEITRAQMVRSILGELLGFALTVSAASYAGGLAGTWAVMRFGFLPGFLVALLAGFAVAWAVRWGWEKLASRR